MIRRRSGAPRGTKTTATRVDQRLPFKPMRIALVSPYSWTYPGGVTRHIESLAGELLERGHEVRVLAPHDPPDRTSALLHRGAPPEPRPMPDHVIPLGRTVGIPMN